MNKPTKMLAAAGALALGLAAHTGTAEAGKPGMEKCYGVVAEGKNDCGTSKHSCAGQAKFEPNSCKTAHNKCAGHGAPQISKEEWLYLPEGICDRLNGGTTTKS